MISVPITWVCEPSRLPPDPTMEGPGWLTGFVEEIGRFAGVSIPAVRGFLREVAPKEGIVLLNTSSNARTVLDECAAAGFVDLACRLVPLDQSRIRIFETYLEPLSLPAMVDTMTIMEWRSADPNRLGARGPYGRRDIGQMVGASCLLYESERYCYLHSPTHHGLPHLLADYLTAYANTVLA